MGSSSGLIGTSATTRGGHNAVHRSHPAADEATMRSMLAADPGLRDGHADLVARMAEARNWSTVRLLIDLGYLRRWPDRVPDLRIRCSSRSRRFLTSPGRSRDECGTRRTQCEGISILSRVRFSVAEAKGTPEHRRSGRVGECSWLGSSGLTGATPGSPRCSIRRRRPACQTVQRLL